MGLELKQGFVDLEYSKAKQNFIDQVSWSTRLSSDWCGYDICLAHRPTAKLSNTASFK